MRRGIRALTLTALGALVAGLTQVAVTAPAAQAAASPDDYCGGQCGDILPPGENGNATLADILAHKVFGTRPPHTADQLDKYANLASGYPGLTDGQLGNFYNNSSFGVPLTQIERIDRPRSDVMVVRDR